MARIKLTLGCVVLAFLAGCQLQGTEESIDGITFTQTCLSSGRCPLDFGTVYALVISPRCLGCHNGPGSPRGVDLSSYEAITSGSSRLVVRGTPQLSDLYLSVKDNGMPRDSEPLTRPMKNLLRDWIAAGAPRTTDDQPWIAPPPSEDEDPGTDTDSATPTEPSEPGDTPSEPTEPGDPGEPVEPDEPSEPTEPSDPDIPPDPGVEDPSEPGDDPTGDPPLPDPCDPTGGDYAPWLPPCDPPVPPGDPPGARSARATPRYAAPYTPITTSGLRS